MKGRKNPELRSLSCACDNEGCRVGVGAEVGGVGVEVGVGAGVGVEGGGRG